jgi:chromosome segregation ATPase
MEDAVMPKTTFLTALIPGIILGVALAWAAPADAGKLYKWVDDDGNVHYTDRPPPESSKEERQVLNERGMVTDTLERQKTPEEIAAAEALEQERLRQEKLAEEQATSDRALLATYSNIEQIEMALAGRINSIDSQINVASSTISTLETRLAELEQRAAQISNNDKPVPEPLQKQIDDTRDELLNNQRYLMRKHEEQETTREKFQNDIDRFKKLRGEDNF